MALHGLGSRREVGALIRSGAVCVNGQTEKHAERRLNPEADEVSINGCPLSLHMHLYLMMNKPAGVLSAARDPKQKTVVDLLPPDLSRRGLFPAGRLDKDTEGLLILTDDGDFAHRMLAPKNHVYKLYEAVVDKPLREEDCRAFEEGIRLEDGELCLSAELWLQQDGPQPLVCVRICEGKFHQVKRMLKAVGKQVLSLRRVQIGACRLDERLSPGQVRMMTQEECQALLKGQKCTKKN